MAHHPESPAAFHGLMAEFESPSALVEAATKVRRAGYTRVDAYSPFPIHGLAEAIGFRERLVAPIVLAGGLTGLLVGYGLQYWTMVIAYPMNIGGRPHHSWVSFIPPTFETTILFASFAAVFGMLALNGFPRPYHPVFNAPRFHLATRDAFFLVIEATDPKFNLDEARAFLAGLHAREVVAVEE
jgi:Alternative complex III, ActD subunit